MEVNTDLGWVEAAGYRLPPDPFFDIHKTLDCGQCFRWNRIAPETWAGVAGGRYLEIRQDEQGVLLKGCSKDTFQDFWRHYFDLDVDYGAVEALYQGLDPRVDEALQFGRGIRLLRQDFWETLISFVLSANNNIPRIQGLVSRLCEAAGEPLGEGICAFPEPDAVARLTETQLRETGMGYRAPFIQKLARSYAAGDWHESGWSGLESEAVRKELMRLPGVGPKVANCVLLFGLGRRDVFPVDTWMKKALATVDRDKPEEKMLLNCVAEGGRCRWTGYLQQVLFYSARTMKWEG